MWVFFGLITLFGSSLLYAYNRLNASWIGTEHKANGITFEYEIIENKGWPDKLLLGIKGPCGDFDYTFKKESTIDRIFKFLGLTSELQTRNKSFDDLVYVVSDSPLVHEHLTKNSKIREAVIAIFKQAKRMSCNIKEVRCNSGRLWVKFSTQSNFDKEYALQNASTLITHLKVIADEFPESSKLKDSKLKDPYVLKAACVLAVSSGLAITGLLYMLRLAFSTLPFIVDQEALFSLAKSCGIIITAALMITSILILKRSSRTHLVLIELLFVGSFGAISTSIGLIRDINIAFDTSPASIYELEVLKKRSAKSRRSNDFYISVVNWNNTGKIKELTEIEVPAGLYRAAFIGDRVKLQQRAGFLGFRWVENIVRPVKSR